MDMLNKYPDIWIDGVSASSLGIRLQGPLQLDPLTPRVEVTQVPGRNGDVIISDGSFENRRARVSAYVYRPEFVQNCLSAIYKWIFAANTYTELVSSGDLDHYYRARIVNGGEIADRIGRLLPFTIEFDCEPIRYLTNPGTFIRLRDNPASLYNDSTVNAYPIYKIFYQDLPDFPTGAESLLVGRVFTQVSAVEKFAIEIRLVGRPIAKSGSLVYDSKTNGVSCQDKSIRVVTKNGLPLIPGRQTLIFTLSDVEINPRWCEL